MCEWAYDSEAGTARQLIHESMPVSVSRQRTVCLTQTITATPRLAHSRNPGRRDGFLWNADSFICPASVDGFRCDVRDAGVVTAPYEDAEDARAVESGAETDLLLPPHEVALMDIARHAKPKGVAKDFEMLDAPRRVIVLDEDAFVDRPDDDEDSDWEDINSFAEVNSDAGASTMDYESEDSDYLLARRLQDEELNVQNMWIYLPRISKENREVVWKLSTILIRIVDTGTKGDSGIKDISVILREEQTPTKAIWRLDIRVEGWEGSDLQDEAFHYGSGKDKSHIRRDRQTIVFVGLIALPIFGGSERNVVIYTPIHIGI
ncbi:hypothetical protein B0H14DRAFT_3173110 [Mycena olivaceomarginata]|nr:hypothetical protein B0H14DRAFT_3173110 [Mycena olivaceomarginata]